MYTDLVLHSLELSAYEINTFKTFRWSIKQSYKIIITQNRLKLTINTIAKTINILVGNLFSKALTEDQKRLANVCMDTKGFDSKTY